AENMHLGRTLLEKKRNTKEAPNRDLLMEFCTVQQYSINNTFRNVHDGKQITYMESGTKPNDAILPDRFALLDLFLVSGVSFNRVDVGAADVVEGAWQNISAVIGAASEAPRGPPRGAAPDLGTR
ncbi:unnamed protein product, partial [Prorocentrum cordatum]